MRTSTQIETASVLVGEEKAVEYVAKAGFDAWDFSMFAMCDYDWRLGAVRPTTHPLAGENYLAFARKLKQIGLDNGITCNQSHAPFPTSCPEIRSYFKCAPGVCASSARKADAREDSRRHKADGGRAPRVFERRLLRCVP